MTKVPVSAGYDKKLGAPNNRAASAPLDSTDGSNGDHGRLTTLAHLRPGQMARVIRVQGDPHLALRILEMGLVPSTGVRFLRSAPMGDPIEIDVEGFLLSLRRNEAEAVSIEVIA